MSIRHMLFDQIVSIDNLLAAWQEFRKGKRNKWDVQVFERHLEDNLFRLHWELSNGIYQHGQYEAFRICDPKPRIIHKASVRDRVVHHAIYQVLCAVFDKTFIFDSYSCRINKGTHKAVDRLEQFLRCTTRNYHNNCYALKCDISKFFASVDHETLKNLLKRRITDSKVMDLLAIVIDSFSVELGSSKGLPLGNLTSQLLANIYMNELDQFVKHNLKVKQYIRYTDDFIIVHEDSEYLQNLIPIISEFLHNQLQLKLHPHKVSIRKSSQGLDFLGYVVLPHYKVLRTKTKRRMFKKMESKIEDFEQGNISGKTLEQAVVSYMGLLQFCESRDTQEKLLNLSYYSCNPNLFPPSNF